MMGEILTVGKLSAGSGQRVSGLETFQAGGHTIRFPLFLINGRQSGPTLAVTAGIHGAEYASIEAALRVGRALQPDTLKGRVIIAPVANMPAFRARSIYVNPLDGINLNRVFPGKKEGGVSEQIAAWLFDEVIRQADYYIDMHGGDLVEALAPFTILYQSGRKETDEASLELGRAYGIATLVRSTSKGSTFAAAAEAGIPAILTEAGGQGIWLEEDIRLHTEGLQRVMRYYQMIPGGAPEAAAAHVLEHFVWLRSEHEGYYYPRVAVGQDVQKGQNLGQITDFEGNVLQEVIAGVDGKVLFLVTSLVINPGDPLLSIGA